MKKIIVYCETKNFKLSETSYELISKAYSLKKFAKESVKIDNDYMVEAVVLASGISAEDVEKAHQAGCDRFVLIKNDDLDIFVQTVYTEAFLEYFNQSPSEIIIFPATPTGRIIAPRITTKCHSGLVADCTDLEFIVKDGILKFASTRPTFGSELMAVILSKSIPQCSTVRPKVFKAEFNKDSKGEFITYNLNNLYFENRITLVSSVIEKTKVNNYKNAKVILSAGYGVASRKDSFEKLKKIANATGAEFAVSRKVVDLGYVSKEFQIGQTGSYTEADVYIAFGISGAIQHIAGMKNCKTIISINTDFNADIFKYSDYKIVADANEIIDKIHSKIVT